jgi:hypothetical protein
MVPPHKIRQTEHGKARVHITAAAEKASPPPTQLVICRTLPCVASCAICAVCGAEPGPSRPYLGWGGVRRGEVGWGGAGRGEAAASGAFITSLDHWAAAVTHQVGGALPTKKLSKFSVKSTCGPPSRLSTRA